MDNKKKSINTPVPSETETKHEHHQMKHDVSAQKPTDHTAMDHSKMDHSKMDHTKMDHGAMDHSTQGGHGGHAGHHEGMIADFKRRFWVVLMLSIPIVILSSMIQMLFGYHLEFRGSKIILFVLSSIVFFYGGIPFLKGALEEIKTRKLGMMMLITLAIVTAYVYSTLTTFILVGSEFYFELSTLILIMLLGHWIEMKSQMGASKALEELVKLMPETAHRLDEHGNITEVSIKELVPGDRIMVKSGEKVPTDARVVEGFSSLNESMLTGESVPVEKTVGMQVIGGSVNGNGVLTVEVERLGDETYLAQVIKTVQDAQAQKSKTQGLAERAAGWLFYIAVAAGIITFVYWFSTGNAAFALERMVTVLVIACPHALGLAVPLVNAVSTSIAARNGLLIRNRSQFEEARNTNRIVFDKTGTLTMGEFGITEIVTQPGISEEALLRIAGSLESQSDHPIAVGIVKGAAAKGFKPEKVTNFENLTGAGLSADLDEKTYYILSPGEVKKRNIAFNEDMFDKLASQGKTVVFVLDGDKLLGMIAVADIIRESSKSIIFKLKKLGIESIMMTGDNQKVADYVGGELGLSKVFAQVLPDQKSKKVQELQKGNMKVAMVGDGINDAPALATADLGIAIGAGTDVAMETADVILVNSDPKDVLNIIKLSKATYRKTIENLIWAAGYNIIAIPLAAGILVSRGFVITPAIGAAVMSLSTIICAVNARLLKID
ncbi:MAG: heavy metal translocating P-type ATPase [Synergistaceae bacterium]|nr:heavy metal translocating P-type ATPase [Synergistaceae bacterium]